MIARQSFYDISAIKFSIDISLDCLAADCVRSTAVSECATAIVAAIGIECD